MERPLVDEAPPHGFDDAEEPAALLQSIPEVWVLLYDDVVVGDIMLFMLIVGRACCCGGEKELPMPGLVAPRAGKDELRALSVLSGVTVRLCVFGAERCVICGAGDTGGVDHENVAAGDALFVDLARFVEVDGKTVDEDADAEAFAHGSPPSMSVPPDEACGPPRTSASNPVSPSPLLESKPLVALGPPKLMNSLRVVAEVLLAPSS